jgi:3-deoxy-D-manno-octulosonic acid (KDO) 8-phosphate synthase
MEVHEDPDRAASDGPTSVPLADLPGLLGQLVAIDRALRDGRVE